MVDMFTKEQRSKNMRAIRSTGSTLESKVTKELWKRGLRFRKNVRKLMGNPDIAIQKHKIVIFLDSCFWHSCPIHGNVPATNVGYWQKKLKRNIDRDIEVNEYYSKKGWKILRIWEHEVKNDFESALKKISHFILSSKQK
ncbi:very short patch repair endonuclease [Brevibacillus formosus]|uniref:Very short patch repair endonuclease n=1 Tax=Brevibacillus formosus TaxID=54913 RepID=A0A837KJP9_9BACL|nr:very short patch repair endonuclease [Brevibacillus formosus]KLH97413.1 DNA mismatch repair protein Vsr [Brevibacillus formosus]MED1958262.1 very short patch repair endonuclease [Brevibacillus formosus]PSJ96771.1 very short patch repair endonuclease [Brevibacillus formosus]GED59946.1 very short patch repair endonuclease [Brevibacillus formosus]